MPKKIAICHYRVGGTDGVSLEIQKRKEILESLGHEVHLIASEIGEGADHIIKGLDWDTGIVPTLKENGYKFYEKKDLNVDILKKEINKLANHIEAKLNFIQLKEKFDYVLIHNIFSFGGHFAAAKAFAKWIKKFKIPTLATHHDFYWDRKEFATPRNDYLKNMMNKFMPPKSKYIEHVVINSLAQKELKKKFDIEADVMADVFDFGQKPWGIDSFNQNFYNRLGIKKNDLVLLQATRIMPRKGIELTLDFAKELQAQLPELAGKKLYNGKTINKDSRLIVLLAGYTEKEKRDQLYLSKIKNKAKEHNLNLAFAAEYISHQRRNGKEKIYSLWDAYAICDMVSYPSIWEGWGNQFIEAIFARKPILLNEYPVFVSDIKKEGYNIVSIGTNGDCRQNEEGLFCLPPAKITLAALEMTACLRNSETNKVLQKNWDIGKKYHDYQILKSFLLNKLKLLEEK